MAALKAMGVRAVFGPGSPTTETIALLKSIEAERPTPTPSRISLAPTVKYTVTVWWRFATSSGIPGNIAHIARHGVTPARWRRWSMVCTCRSRRMQDEQFSSGAHSGRMVTVILDLNDPQGTYYVVTARPASRKERRHYQSQTEGTST